MTSSQSKADPTRFPHGIKWLADQLHGMGLKLGIYLNNGKWTCQHYAGSEGYLTADVQRIASWEVDGLKLDGCYMTMNTFNRVNDSYAEASAAIRASKRQVGGARIEAVALISFPRTPRLCLLVLVQYEPQKLSS